MGKISVIIKEPGKTPRHVNISGTLENLQKTVGGYIECVTLFGGMAVICDEEGRIKGKERCCNICGVDFVGTVILVGVDGEEFCDLPVGYADVKRMMPKMWEVQNEFQ